MIYKYIVSEETDPYYNLALEKYLFDEVCLGETLIYFWQNDNTIVIGKNQNPFSELRLEEYVSNGGRLARRMSGGGAVYHDMGNLNFSFITKKSEIGQVSYQNIITEALLKFGLRVSFNGKNDLLIDGKKFSGNAAYDDGNIVCQHGTLLVDSDIKRMSFYLTPDISKLEKNHVKSVSARVVNLSELSPDISIDNLMHIIIKNLCAERLDIVVNSEKLRKNIDFFSDKNWLRGGK